MRLVFPGVLLTFFLSIAVPWADGISQDNSLTDLEEGCGFSLLLPPGWNASFSGSQAKGNMSLHGPDGDIRIIWIRDPGFSPDECLDMLLNAHSGPQVGVSSSRRWDAGTPNKRYMDISYKYMSYTQEKRFAVWRQSDSDRLFLVISEGGKRSLMDGILETYEDRAFLKATLLPRRNSSKDAWGAVLQDVLSSRRYDQTGSMKAFSLKAQVTFVLSVATPSGDLALSSRDSLNLEPPAMAQSRLAAVEQLLEGYGYRTEVMQMSGRLWLAAQDPSGRWQAISVNPANPLLHSGVLIASWDDSWYTATAYNRTADLESYYGLAAQNGPAKLVKVTDPPVYATIRSITDRNDSWVLGLQALLDRYSYPLRYSSDVFDCSNTSQICWVILQEKGYQARIMASYEGHLRHPHMWVVVLSPDASSAVAVETASTDETGTLIGLGRTVWDDRYYDGIMYSSSVQYSHLHPEEGIWAAPG